MRTNVKRGVVDKYLKRYPNATAKVVSEKTGCHLATVYLAKKRLGIQSNGQKPLVFEYVTTTEASPIVSGEKHPVQLHHEEIEKLKGKVSVAKAELYCLAGVVGLLVLCFVYYG